MDDMSRVVRKPAFCICENKDADQLCGNREADQRLCFCYMDSTIPLLPKSEISSIYPSSVAVQPGLCRTSVRNQNVGFLMMRLIISLSRATYRKVPKFLDARNLAVIYLKFKQRDQTL